MNKKYLALGLFSILGAVSFLPIKQEIKKNGIGYRVDEIKKLETGIDITQFTSNPELQFVDFFAYDGKNDELLNSLKDGDILVEVYVYKKSIFDITSEQFLNRQYIPSKEYIVLRGFNSPNIR